MGEEEREPAQISTRDQQRKNRGLEGPPSYQTKKEMGKEKDKKRTIRRNVWADQVP